MRNFLKPILVALAAGTIVSLGTYFYQREGAYGGICVHGVKSPCNGDMLYDRGFPARYVDPDNEINYQALMADIIFWSIMLFALLRFGDHMRKKSARNDPGQPQDKRLP